MDLPGFEPGVPTLRRWCLTIRPQALKHFIIFNSINFYMPIVIFFGEIFLKGKNRMDFINKLENNIKNVLGNINIKKYHDRIVIDSNDEKIAEICSKIFGVATVYLAEIIERNLDLAAEVAKKEIKNKSYCVRVDRIDKKFPLTSKEIENYIGKKIGGKVDLENPEITVRFKVYSDSIYFLKKKYEGIGGLPVGTSGKVLSLLSGGIDSAVSSYLTMKRGCMVDFLHFYAYSSVEEVEKSKIFELVKKIVETQKLKVKIYLVPYYIFHTKALEANIKEKIELTVFRRFMVRVANELCKKYKYKAIVTGDNLGQVASQTLENLALVDKVSEFPVFRPLLTFDKKEIIELAKKIGTYEISIKDYKDCCSIISLNPATKPKLENVLEAEKKMDIEKVVENSIKEMSIKEIEANE